MVVSLISDVEVPLSFSFKKKRIYDGANSFI